MVPTHEPFEGVGQSHGAATTGCTPSEGVADGIPPVVPRSGGGYTRGTSPALLPAGASGYQDDRGKRWAGASPLVRCWFRRPDTVSGALVLRLKSSLSLSLPQTSSPALLQFSHSRQAAPADRFLHRFARG